MTSEVILNPIKYLRIQNVSIHIIFYQNRFINKCFRKNFLKFHKKKDGKTDFFVICRRTYVQNNTFLSSLIFIGFLFKFLPNLDTIIRKSILYSPLLNKDTPFIYIKTSFFSLILTFS